MIKRIQGRKLGEKVGQRVIVKSFPGATTTDMKDYLKPALKRKPQRIILHTGTNDLSKSTPVQVADNIVDLARMIESESDAEIILSEIVITEDNIPDDKINTVNKLVNRYTNQNGWAIMWNDNITKHHLDGRGLHLNEESISVTGSNLIRCLSKW